MKGLNGIVLIGRPGCGKSEIGKIVANAHDSMTYVSSGDIARGMANTDDRVANLLNDGKMAPESAMRTAMRSALYDINYHRGTFVLDGFPRTTDQLEWLQEHHPNLWFYHIFATEELCVDRMLDRKRDDDYEQTIRSRMRFYNDFTTPILDAIPHVTIPNMGGLFDAVGRLMLDIDERIEGFANSGVQQVRPTK